MVSVAKKTKIKLFMIIGLVFLAFTGVTRHASADDGGIFFMVKPSALTYCNGVYTSSSFNPWYEGILSTVRSSADSVGSGVYGKLVGGTKKFAAALLGLWIALLALKQVGSMTETDGLEFATKIGGICIKAAIVFIIINPGTFKEYIWNPIVIDVPGEIGDPGANGSALDRAIKAGEATKCIADIWGFDFSLGKYPKGEDDAGLTDPGIYIHGCFPIFFAFLMSVAIPIFMCDLYLRRGIVLAFCPLFVAAFLFPVTKDFGNKGVNAALNVIFFQIVLYILLQIACEILVTSAGLSAVSGNMSEATIKNLMCSLRLFGSSDSEECQGAAGYSGNNLIVMVVMGVYCIYMLTLTDKYAEYFSGASFGDTGSAALGAVKKTGAMMGTGVGMAKSAAGATGRFAGKAMDRMAARTVEKARSGGTPGGFRANLASFYLKQRGILNKDGSETKAYGAALANGTRRSIANFVSGGRLYKNEAYQNWAKNGGPRDNATAAAADASYQNRLGNKPKPASGSGSTPKKTPDQLNKEKAKSSQTLADAQKYMSQNTDYSKMPNGQNQKSYDRMRAANTQMQANFDKKVAADPNYANSAQGKAEQKKIQDDRAKVDAFAQKNNVNTMAMDRCEARVRGSMDPNMNSHAKASDKLNRVADAQRNAIANTSYPNTAAGNIQKSYDTQRAAQSQAWADHQAKIASDPSYKGSDQWRQDRQQLRAQDDNLQKMAKDNNLDTSKMDKAESSTLDNDKMMKRAMIHARITGGIRDRVDAVTSTVSNTWNSAKTTASNTWDSAKNTARDARDAVKAVPTNIRNGLNSAANKVSDTWNSAKDSVKDARDSVADSVNRKANRVADTFDSVKDKLSGTIGRIKNK